MKNKTNYYIPYKGSILPVYDGVSWNVKIEKIVPIAGREFDLYGVFEPEPIGFFQRLGYLICQRLGKLRIVDIEIVWKDTTPPLE